MDGRKSLRDIQCELGEGGREGEREGGREGGREREREGGRERGREMIKVLYRKIGKIIIFACFIVVQER